MRDVAIELFCRLCAEGTRIQERIPPICPRCAKPTIWVSAVERDPPKVKYQVTINDHKFLRALRIQSDWPLAGTVES